MPSPRAPLTEKDILLEFQQVGTIVRVNAIDPRTNTEVTIQGPASAGRAILSHNAINKLNYVLRNKG
ncbi:DUF6898 family protein [Niveispirillum irakense]|uniref:DUF6898 family protein n=1 Tax=Niveispirillum irakense TaxID=34011 RepID=UPI0009FC1B34|nr:hypothetical protein [Niveispirillum irakense]